MWVPETRRTSRDLLILVEQSAEPVAPPDGVNLGCCALGERSQVSGLAESAVRPGDRCSEVRIGEVRPWRGADR